MDGICIEDKMQIDHSNTSVLNGQSNSGNGNFSFLVESNTLAEYTLKNERAPE